MTWALIPLVVASLVVAHGLLTARGGYAPRKGWPDDILIEDVYGTVNDNPPMRSRRGSLNSRGHHVSGH